MSRYFILDAAGEPVETEDLPLWYHWYANSHRTVAQTAGEEGVVLTVFLGVDNSSGVYTDPILWETTYQYKETIVDRTRDSGTRADAFRMHEEMCIKHGFFVEGGSRLEWTEADWSQRKPPVLTVVEEEYELWA